MRFAYSRWVGLLVGILLFKIPCAAVESVSLQDMLGKHLDRVMRKQGILLPTRHGEPFTNWFGRVIMEGDDALPFGYNYIQLRDSDGWAEVRDETGALTREVAPIREDAAFVLGDLFGFLPSEDTPPELRLSHLVSKWLVCHSQEESDAIDITDDEWDVLQSERTRRRNLRNHRLAEAPLVVTNLMTTAIVPSEDYVDLMVEWPSSMTLPYDFLDLYCSVDLRNWTRYDRYDVITCQNQFEVQIPKASIPGFLEHLPAQHESTCYIVTNISASAFQPGVSYTNRHWNCDHKPRGETPGFFDWRALEEVGFAEQWIRDNYPDDAEDIITRGYDQWVDDQVGYGLTNGYYKLNAYVYSHNWVWQDPKTIRVGEQEIRVFVPGTYSFLLEKGIEYEIETTFARDEITFSMQDDLANSPVLADAWWDGLFWRGVWSEVGGECVICNAHSGTNGFCCWLPRLRGSPDVDHVSENRTLTFTAELLDYRQPENATFLWMCDDPNVRIVSPDAQTTDIEFLSFPSWRVATISVQVLDITYYNVFASSLRFTYGENSSPRDHLRLNVPRGLPSFGEYVPMVLSFSSDSGRTGTLLLECTRGMGNFEIAESPEELGSPQSREYEVEGDTELTLYIRGLEVSDYQGVCFRLSFIPDEGGDGLSVEARTTVFACYVEPISNVLRSGLTPINPSFLSTQTDAIFRVNVVPQDIPDAEISWTVSDGSASIQAGANAKEVLVQGQSGMVDLSVSVLGVTDERMHFKANVIE